MATMTQTGTMVTWHWSKREADSWLAAAKRGSTIKGSNYDDEYQFGEVQPFDFKPNRDGIMRLLNRTPIYDNG